MDLESDDGLVAWGTGFVVTFSRGRDQPGGSIDDPLALSAGCG